MDRIWLDGTEEMNDQSDTMADFAVLHTDGRLEYGRSSDEESLLDSVKRHISGRRGTMGLRLVRAWYSDDFAIRPGMPVNRLADRVFTSLGYHHFSGWCGTVVLTMEEDLDSGEIPPLTPTVVAALEALSGGHRAGVAL